MGGGSWTSRAYDDRAAHRAATGKATFDYSARTAAKPASARSAHTSLDPKGLKVRESRDSDEHPETVAIAVWLDVTGSMNSVITAIHASMPKLMALVLSKGYVSHPQILFGGIGDATCDTVPLQVAQFESDIRMEEHLTNLYIEGGGGGQNTESYELGFWVMANKTVADCWEKRGKRGYAFFIGDELAYDKVSRRQVEQLIGDKMQSDEPFASAVAQVQEKWETYYILPKGAQRGSSKTILDFWRKHLGQYVLELDNASMAAELIASTIGLAEGRTIDEVQDDLRSVGADARGVSRALSTVKAGTDSALTPVGSVTCGELVTSTDRRAKRL